MQPLYPEVVPDGSLWASGMNITAPIASGYYGEGNLLDGQTTQRGVWNNRTKVELMAALKELGPQPSYDVDYGEWVDVANRLDHMVYGSGSPPYYARFYDVDSIDPGRWLSGAALYDIGSDTYTSGNFTTYLRSSCLDFTMTRDPLSGYVLTAINSDGDAEWGPPTSGDIYFAVAGIENYLSKFYPDADGLTESRAYDNGTTLGIDTTDLDSNAEVQILQIHDRGENVKLALLVERAGEEDRDALIGYYGTTGVPGTGVMWWHGMPQHTANFVLEASGLGQALNISYPDRNMRVGGGVSGERLSVSGNVTPSASGEYSSGTEAEPWGSGWFKDLHTDAFMMPTNPADSYVLTSDSRGKGTWQAVGAGEGVTGSGTINYMTKWATTTSITDSRAYDDGTTTGLDTEDVDHNASMHILQIQDRGGSVKLGLLVDKGDDESRDALIGYAGSTGVTWYHGMPTNEFDFVLSVSGNCNQVLRADWPDGYVRVGHGESDERLSVSGNVVSSASGSYGVGTEDNLWGSGWIKDLHIENFYMPTDPVANYVLTTDGAGQGTWQDASSLPGVGGLWREVNYKNFFCPDTAGVNFTGASAEGDYNIALGEHALNIGTNADGAIAIGAYAGYDCWMYTGDIAIGYGAMRAYTDETGSNGLNIAIGPSTLEFLWGTQYTIAIGSEAGDYVEDAYGCVYIGREAGVMDTAGEYNVYVGHMAGWGGESGEENVAIGECAHNYLKGADGNASVGVCSLNGVRMGSYPNYTYNTGDNNTALGSYTAIRFAEKSSKNVYLGYRAGPSTITIEHNKLYIDNDWGTPLIAGEMASGFVGILVNPHSLTNILQVQETSTTDPIADDWTTYASDRQHKDILGASSGVLSEFVSIPVYKYKRKPLVTSDDVERGVEAIATSVVGGKGLHKKAKEIVEGELIKKYGLDGNKKGRVRPEIPKGKMEHTMEQMVLAKELELMDKEKEKVNRGEVRKAIEKKKGELHKYSTERFGMSIDDPQVPESIVSVRSDGQKGISTLGYIGYLHAALKETVELVQSQNTKIQYLEEELSKLSKKVVK